MEENLITYIVTWGIVFILIIGAVILDNFSESEKCRLMRNNNFLSKLEPKMIISQECYILDEDTGRYIPYEKFRVIAND